MRMTRARPVWARQANLSGMLSSLIVANLAVAGTGYLKDLLVASYLGTGAMGDAFTTSYFVVDLVGSVVFGSAVGVATASTFGALSAEKSWPEFRSQVVKTLGGVCLVSILAMSVVWALRGPLLHPFSADGDAYGRMKILYLSLLPMVGFYPVYFFVSGVLQASGKYVLSVLAPATLNTVVVLVGVALLRWHVPVYSGVLVLTLSISAGSIITAAVVLIAWTSWARKVHAVPSAVPSTVPLPHAGALRKGLNDTLMRLWRLVGGYALYLLLLQGLGLVERYIIATLPTGSLAAFTYAVRLEQVPNWVFVSSIGTLFLPHLARAFQKEEWSEFGAMLDRGVDFCVAITLPMAIVFVVLRTPIVQILFQRGAFDSTSTGLTSAFVSGFAVAILFQALAAFFLRVAAGTARLATPIVITAVSGICAVVFDVLFISHLGAITLGLGEGVAGVVTTVLMWSYLRRRTFWRYKVHITKVRGIFLSNLVVTGMSCGILVLYNRFIEKTNGLSKFLLLGVCLVAVAAVYGFLLWRTLNKVVRGRGKYA